MMTRLFPLFQRLLAIALVVAALGIPSAWGQTAPEGLLAQRGALFTTLEWELEHAAYEGNPFDLLAWATFTHEASGETLRTPMFYAGEGRWRFRFTATRSGEWTLVTESAEAPLDGWRGRIAIDANADPKAHGFLTAAGNKFAVQSAEDELSATLYHVYFDHGFGEQLHHYPAERGAFVEALNHIFDEIEAHGMDALFIVVSHNWLEYGAMGHHEHESEVPDLKSFEKLELAITMAHQRGLHLHLWAWGDEDRFWTPIGLRGGINGEVDRRLQRYIAARLGPLPGWTMSYGFDLEEWVTPDEVRAWAQYLHEHSPWPRLLMAREWGTFEGYTFLLGDDKLDVYSNDHRPTGASDPYEFYAVARESLERGLPVLFERRFLHTRDEVWDLKTTRRALWQFTMAGGAGAIWGVLWDGGEPYPESEPLKSHGRFWHTWFALELEPVDGISDALVLATPDLTRVVLYQQDTQVLAFDLSEMPEAHAAVAFDTRSGDELPLGVLEPGTHRWQAPYLSDWAIAIGSRARH